MIELTLWVALVSGTTPSADVLEGKKLLDLTLAAHGAKSLSEQCYDFVFRGNLYRMARHDGVFKYENHSRHGHAILTNKKFIFLRDNKPLLLTPRQESQGRQGLNSVVYFASLPLPLKDPSVLAKALPSQTIRGVEFKVLDVRFEEDDGGDYPKDIFRYWIHPESGLIEYFAYRTEVGPKGRVRFRVPKQRSTVGGFVFTDWDNYGVGDASIPLEELPKRWVSGDLPKLSEIVLDELKAGC